MSPALLKKYLAAARLVADHLVLLPDGFAFAPHPAVTDTDRDKYCVRRIIDFYQRHEVDYADYFLAAWRYQHRDALGKPRATLREFAEEAGLSPQYLATIWAVLTEPAPTSEAGPLGKLRALWRKLPADAVAGGRRPSRLRADARRWLSACGAAFEPRVPEIEGAGASPRAASRSCSGGTASSPRSGCGTTGIATPADAPERERFCARFPDTFFVTDRAPYFEPNSGPSGRLLTAGFHLMQGYFRDDEPLCELVLDEADRRELDALWYELDFVTAAPMRQYHDFIFFERAEPPRFMQEARFDFARSEDKDCDVRGQDDAAARGLPGQGPQDRGGRPRRRGDRDLFRDDVRPDSPGRERPAGRGAAPSGGPREVRRARLPPAAARPASATTCSPSIASRASQAGSATRRRSATRSPACCYRPTSATASDQVGTGRVDPAAVRLCPGEPAELFPLVEHARRRAAGARRGRRPAPAGGARRAGAADAPRRPGPRPGRRVRGQLAGVSPVRGAQRRRPRAVPRLHQRAAPGDVRGADPLLPRRRAARWFGARVPRGRSHVRQPDPGEALRHPDNERSGPTSGCGSTASGDMAAADCCRWRSS